MTEEEKNKFYAVIIGDIVRSSTLEQKTLAQLPSKIREISAAFFYEYPDAFLFGFEPFRGDSFQALLKKPQLAPLISLRFRIAMRLALRPSNVDARFAIGIGKVNVFPQKTATEGNGEAYKVAGKALDKLGSQRRFVIAYPNPQYGKTGDTICDLLDKITWYWTPRQLQTLDLALKGLTQVEIGKHMQPPINQQTTGEHLRKASWNSVKRALNSLSDEINSYIKVHV